MTKVAFEPNAFEELLALKQYKLIFPFYTPMVEAQIETEIEQPIEIKSL